MTDKKSHRKVYIIGGVMAAIMFGFCFAMVPLYSVICRATGINTSVPGQLVTPTQGSTGAPDLSRDITVQFLTVTHNGMAWDFYPRTQTIHVHPGENNKVLFYVKNTTDKDMTVQAIPSMTPTDAMVHFHKIQCFCFTQQSLKAHESKDMPMIFQIDKDLPKDIRVISLAYTLFDVTPKAARKG
jgi:cytochrome c oxidase assembly protein subunit 11